MITQSAQVMNPFSAVMAKPCPQTEGSEIHRRAELNQLSWPNFSAERPDQTALKHPAPLLA